MILINKPRGITSFGVVSRLRKMTGVRKIGHAGTLDPFADGLLPVCLGRATAVVQFMDGYDKTYRLGIAFGRATDTQDCTGQTTFAHDLTEAEKQDLRQSDFAVLRRAVAALPGERQQVPPMYSAVKIDGRPLYQYARQGREIERKSRLIHIYEASLGDIALDGTLEATIEISCSKGTYIRTLADDLGRELGFGAHAASLTRLRCGPFQLKQAQDLEQLFAWRESCPDQPAFLRLLRERGLLLPAESALADLVPLELPEEAAVSLINGQVRQFGTDELAGWLPEDRRGRTDLLPIPGGRAIAFSSGRLVAVVRLDPCEPGQFEIKSERVLIDLADFRQS